MRVAREEIFGPVLSVVRVGDLDEALAVGRDCPYGNGASIFTRSGWAAREFKHRFNAGMIGINVGVPAPMAWFPFTGWNQSFFGDLHIQGIEGVQFYTRQKMTMTRWFASAERLAPRPGLEGGPLIGLPRAHPGRGPRPGAPQSSTILISGRRSAPAGGVRRPGSAPGGRGGDRPRGSGRPAARVRSARRGSPARGWAAVSGAFGPQPHVRNSLPTHGPSPRPASAAAFQRHEVLDRRPERPLVGHLVAVQEHHPGATPVNFGPASVAGFVGLGRPASVSRRARRAWRSPAIARRSRPAVASISRVGHHVVVRVVVGRPGGRRRRPGGTSPSRSARPRPGRRRGRGRAGRIRSSCSSSGPQPRPSSSSSPRRPHASISQSTPLGMAFSSATAPAGSSSSPSAARVTSSSYSSSSTATASGRPRRAARSACSTEQVGLGADAPPQSPRGRRRPARRARPAGGPPAGIRRPSRSARTRTPPRPRPAARRARPAGRASGR